MKCCRVRFSVLCLSTIIIVIGLLQCRGNPVLEHPFQIVVDVYFFYIADNEQPRCMNACEKRLARMWTPEDGESAEKVARRLRRNRWDPLADELDEGAGAGRGMKATGAFWLHL